MPCINISASEDSLQPETVLLVEKWFYHEIQGIMVKVFAQIPQNALFCSTWYSVFISFANQVACGAGTYLRFL